VNVALAWGYVLWLAADMDMGGMDMTGFRMIPAGMGIMAPARAVEFAFAMWAVMMVGMMTPSSCTPAWVDRECCGQAAVRNRLVRLRLFPGWHDPCPMDGRTPMVLALAPCRVNHRPCNRSLTKEQA
jgi:hypothetical protein